MARHRAAERSRTALPRGNLGRLAGRHAHARADDQQLQEARGELLGARDGLVGARAPRRVDPPDRAADVQARRDALRGARGRSRRQPLLRHGRDPGSGVARGGEEARDPVPAARQGARRRRG